MKNTGTISLIFCLAITAWLLTDKYTTKTMRKIGVVQMEKLVYDFKGMKEATKNYTVKIEQWKSQSDSMEVTLKELYTQIRLDSLIKNQAKLDKDIRTFVAYKQRYEEHLQVMQEKAGDADKQMTLGVINQVNESIKTYAQEQGYDVILCNSAQQSVGYAKNQVDVTEQVLEFANKQYEGVK